MITLTLPSGSPVVPPFPRLNGEPWDELIARSMRYGAFHGAKPGDLRECGLLRHRKRPRHKHEVILVARWAILEALDRFLKRLARRGIKGAHLWVEEAHEDGTAHVHVAYNDSALRAAYGDDWAKVRAYLQEIAYDAGLGFIDWSAGKRGNPRAIAFELSKYIGKTFAPIGKGRPLWREALGCTVEAGFQKGRFHRWGGSRAPARLVRESLGGPPKETGRYELVMRVPMVSRRCPLCRQTVECWHRKVEPRIVAELSVQYIRWSPGHSVAICEDCPFHFPDPSLPFLCHHEPPMARALGCWCRPPWLFEYVAPMPPSMARFVANPEAVPPKDRHGDDDPFGIDPQILRNHRWALERREKTRTDALGRFRTGPDVSQYPLSTHTSVPPDEGASTPLASWACDCPLCHAALSGCATCPGCRKRGTLSEPP